MQGEFHLSISSSDAVKCRLGQCVVFGALEDH